GLIVECRGHRAGAREKRAFEPGTQRGLHLLNEAVTGPWEDQRQQPETEELGPERHRNSRPVRAGGLGAELNARRAPPEASAGPLPCGRTVSSASIRGTASRDRRDRTGSSPPSPAATQAAATRTTRGSS